MYSRNLFVISKFILLNSILFIQVCAYNNNNPIGNNRNFNNDKEISDLKAFINRYGENFIKIWAATQRWPPQDIKKMSNGITKQLLEYPEGPTVRNKYSKIKQSNSEYKGKLSFTTNSARSKYPANNLAHSKHRRLLHPSKHFNRKMFNTRKAGVKLYQNRSAIHNHDNAPFKNVDDIDLSSMQANSMGFEENSKSLEIKNQKIPAESHWQVGPLDRTSSVSEAQHLRNNKILPVTQKQLNEHAYTMLLTTFNPALIYDTELSNLSRMRRSASNGTGSTKKSSKIKDLIPSHERLGELAQIGLNSIIAILKTVPGKIFLYKSFIVT